MRSWLCCFDTSAIKCLIKDRQSGKPTLSFCRLTTSASCLLTRHAAGNSLGWPTTHSYRAPKLAGRAGSWPQQVQHKPQIVDTWNSDNWQALKNQAEIPEGLKSRKKLSELVVPFIVSHVILRVISCSNGNHS